MSAFENLISDTKELPEKKKILFVAAEAAPYATVGGFASVVMYLSRELRRLGHDVRIFIPKYGFLDEEKYELEKILDGLRVPTGNENNKELICNVKYHDKEGVPTYFLENREYYELRANVYGYADDPTRWALLSRGVLEFIKEEIFVPDIIHCHDWHTGLVSNYLKNEYSSDDLLSDIATLYTIHNLSLQGTRDYVHVTELEYDDGKSPVLDFFDGKLPTQNFMKRGIIYSDTVNTVSKTYSKEILTPENGAGLDKLLLELKSKLFGIVNGLDYDEFNPATDSLLEQNYDINTLNLREENKKALQKEFDLPVNPNVLLLGFVGRLTWQKGVDLLSETLRHALKDFDVQFVQVGNGDMEIVTQLHDLKKEFPDKVGIHTYSNFTLPRLVFSGCDAILYPSRFEPCGIVQLEAMRYGSIPIVRKVGGLADTVENFDPVSGKGTGFVFSDFNGYSLYGQIVRAHELYRQKPIWKKLQKNAMSADFSWGFSAKEYERLYERTLSLKKMTTNR